MVEENIFFWIYNILISVLIGPAMFIGPAVILAFIYRLILYFAKVDSKKAKKYAWMSFIILEVGWLFVLMFMFGPR
jgi:hypothetical protein